MSTGFDWSSAPIFVNRPLRIAVAVQQVIPGDSDFVNQSLKKIFAKTGGMSSRQANVFVQMENLDPAPIDIGRAGQGIQKFKLRCPSCGYETGTSLIAKRPPERARGMIGCCLAQGIFICKNFYFSLQHRVQLASTFLRSFCKCYALCMLLVCHRLQLVHWTDCATSARAMRVKWYASIRSGSSSAF